MRFLVTGATGFVGRAVTRRILADGDEAHVLVRSADGASDLAEAGATVHVGSIGDPNQVADAARGCEVVVHAAAVASFRSAVRALDWTNVAGTENVISAARHVACTRVVYVSCADVTLCNEDRVHWNEDRALSIRPVDAHARSKLLSEELALAANGTGLEVTALRPAWIWGPGDTSTLPLLCKEAGGGGLRLVGSGANLMSTTYIDNFVDAVIAAAEVEAAPGHAYYVTDSEFSDSREFFEALSRAAGLPPPRAGMPFGLAHTVASVREWFGTDGWWPTDVLRRGRSTMFDAQNAIRDLSWEPRVTMEEGMKALSAWTEQVGGATAVAAMARAPVGAAAVDAQVAAAGGDGAK